ncbi:TetR family transcriptional regulator [Enterococcus casseliflavus]|uniref:TetR/AcrR family transcriptional regulator n=1 Tax=Enterococcus casseliflavus TaxID=37734 RepID=UPI001C8CE6BE|nr:TetR/AcrR family transcriptional regulator [Enterococcus casseliflavus]MBX9115189.1 TetR family transcriptional regulator [Enterococcus casseliflavus]MBX9125294.1 TetR family transcriptional regulator [Enterococcus casseliflavus]
MLTYLSLNRQILIKCTEKRGNDMVGTVGNRRTIYSKKVIRRAFQELLLEKEYRKITIKEIAERADINRGTFYKYYKDTAALLEEIEGELVEQIASNLQQENLSLDLWLEKLLTILYENPSTTHLILLNNSHLLNLLLSEIKPETLKRFAQYFQDASEEELELCLSFFVCGAIGLIERWLKDFSTMSPKAVAELLIQIFVTNVYEDKKG